MKGFCRVLVGNRVGKSNNEKMKNKPGSASASPKSGLALEYGQMNVMRILWNVLLTRMESMLLVVVEGMKESKVEVPSFADNVGLDFDGQ